MRRQNDIKKTGVIILFSLIMTCNFNSYSTQDSTTTLKKQFQKDLTEFEKKKANLKKKKKSIEKKLSFKNLIHHVDSEKKVTQFIHQQHHLVKSDASNPYNIDHKNLGLEIKPYKMLQKFEPEYQLIDHLIHLKISLIFP